MIGYIAGKVIAVDSAKCVVLTLSGIGYEVQYSKFAQINSQKEFFIATVIKEVSHTLFGFDSIDEKTFFESLLSVNGVGPKSAFSLVSSIGIPSLIQAITLEQTDVLKQAPGVGKKAAEQIILSMKNKVKKLELSNVAKFNSEEVTGEVIDTASVVDAALLQESLMALESLGYKNEHVLPVLKRNMSDATSSSELIKTVLREL